MEKYNKTLVIGDAHDDPRFNQERFCALGNFIVANQPDNIVQIGDWANLDSISFHDRKTPLLREGRRLADDLRSADDAYIMMMEPTYKYNNKRGIVRKKKYQPNGYWLLGNHEQRTTRYVAEVPELSGFIPEGALVNLDPWWKVVPYKDRCWIQGCAFTHAPINPNSGQPFAGRYVTRRALDYTANTIVFGHCHVRQIDSIQRVEEGSSLGRRIDSVCVGCYLDYTPGYVRGVRGALNWWSGLTIIHHEDNEGRIDVETISIDRVKREYL